jgi:AraC family transcriptional regulator of adaptative response / DNA-3-methyladenine glycosylase II
MQAAKTARVQRAKRLLDVTDLQMTEVALRAGFRSLRRFNAVFVEVYRRSPSAVRRFARANGRGPRAGKPEERHLRAIMDPVEVGEMQWS